MPEIMDNLQILQQAFPELIVERERDIIRHRDLITIKVPTIKCNTSMEYSHLRYINKGIDIVAETTEWLKSVGYIKE